ncbi:MAG: Fe2+ transport system protein A [Halonotius sp. J07HN4]|jgi:Fe2+ transport system protein A|nr:MAG: Fe2+ transport system protein A [Halonotius sp. J07HN4]
MNPKKHNQTAQSSTDCAADDAGCRRQGCPRARGECKQLTELECGETGTIECVECGRRNLHSMGVRPGKQITVCTKHPFDGPIVVSVGQSTVSLSRSHAQNLDVVAES